MPTYDSERPRSEEQRLHEEGMYERTARQTKKVKESDLVEKLAARKVESFGSPMTPNQTV